MLAERMQTELGDQSVLLERHFRALEGFTRTMPIPGARENLHAALFLSLQAKTEQVRKYAELTMRALSQHVAIRNTQVILRLQRQSLLLALIVTVATLLLLWANWDQIARFSSQVLDRVLASLSSPPARSGGIELQAMRDVLRGSRHDARASRVRRVL
jgi:hypothetical protein